MVALTLLLGALAIVLGGLGLYLDPSFSRAVAEDGALAAWTELLFGAVGLLAFEHPAVAPTNAWFSLARLATFLFALGALFSILLALYRALHAWYVGILSTLRPRRGHAVVFGLGRIGMQIVRDLRANDREDELGVGPRRPVIVVEPEEDHPNADTVRRLGAIVLFGDAREPATRRRARLHSAREAFVACGDDALDVDVAGDILRDFRQGRLERPWLLRRSKTRRHRHLQCHVHVGDPSFSRILHSQGLIGAERDPVDFHVFNVLENAARQLLLDPSWGLARCYVPSEEEVAHYVLFGFGPTGQTVALHMARLAHFGNHRRLRLTIVDDFESDPRMRKAQRSFLERHPGFCPAPPFSLTDESWRERPDRDEWACRGARPAAEDWRFPDPEIVEYAVNAEFLEMGAEVDSPRLLGELGDRLARDKDPAVRGAVVVCFDDDRRNFQAALRLLEGLRRLPAERSPATPLPLYPFLPTESGLSLLLAAEADAADEFPIHPFGGIEENAGYPSVVRPLIRDLAAWMHLAYEALRSETPERRDPGTRHLEIEQRVGTRPPDVDPATVYAVLPPAFKSSNEDAAAHGEIKLDAIRHRRLPWNGAQPPPVRLSVDQLERLARMEHNRWMAERLVTGWRSGPRDDRRLRRLAFRPWEHLLDREERAKDEIQVRALVSGLNSAGQVVVPRPPDGSSLSPGDAL